MTWRLKLGSRLILCLAGAVVERGAEVLGANMKGKSEMLFSGKLSSKETPLCTVHSACIETFEYHIYTTTYHSYTFALPIKFASFFKVLFKVLFSSSVIKKVWACPTS